MIYTIFFITMQNTIMTSNRVKTCIQEARARIMAIMTAVCAGAMLMLSGCAGLFIEQYGYAASNAAINQEDGRTVFLPYNAPSISQGYHPKPVKKHHRKTSPRHEGLDIAGSTGTPVIAAASGIVVSSYFEPFAGHRVVIDHGKDEYGVFIQSRYFHLHKRLVKKGDRVVRGQEIGTLGSTGLLASFPHLHYEIRGAVHSQPMDPHRFWTDGNGVVTCFDSSRQWPDEPVKTTYPVPCLKKQ